MPTYEYRCANCGHELEAVQSFSDAALTECPQCGEPALRKMFGNVGVVFKGSGFYRNDSRNEAKSRGKAGGPAPKTSEAPATSAGDSGKAAAPAADKSAPASASGSSGSSGGTGESGKKAPAKAKAD